jgi:tetratricopeptide (TPR) repeat protein
MKMTLYILSFLFSLSFFAQNDVVFDKANTLYNEGKYADAISQYESILATKNHSAALYFNLGNAHYKLNHIAPSIYYYEKALQLDPNDSDIKNNLALAKNMTIDAINIIPEGSLSKILNNTANSLTFDSWAKVSIGFVFCFVVLFLIYYFAYSSFRKRFAFLGSMATLFLMCVTLLFAFHKFNLDKLDKPAIVFAQESSVKNEPNSRSDDAFNLHEGTKVQVLDTVNNWKKIKLQDGKTGWISSVDIKAL